MTEAGVNPDIRCRDLTDDDVKKISAVIDETQTVEVIFVEKSLSTSRDYRKSDAIEESVTEKDFRFVVRRLRQMQEQEKVLREQ